MRDLNVMDLNLCVRCLPKQVRHLMNDEGDRVIVAGGYIRSVIMNDKVNDVDIFAGNRDRSLALANTLSPDNKPYTTKNAITIRNLSIAVQFIHRWTFDKPEDIIDSFDFTICQTAFWYNRNTHKWVGICSDRFYMDLAAKRLHYLRPTRDEAPGGTMLRVLKYYQRGYRIPLDSLGAVISRICSGFDFDRSDFKNEETRTAILTGLLFEVDPNNLIQHQPYFPNESAILNGLSEDVEDIIEEA